MRTNIVFDDELVEEAFRHSNAKTKRELVDLVLREFVENHKRKDVCELHGKVRLRKGYDHKWLRETGLVASQKDFEWLDEYLSTQRFYHPRDPVASYRETALLYFPL